MKQGSKQDGHFLIFVHALIEINVKATGTEVVYFEEQPGA